MSRRRSEERNGSKEEPHPTTERSRALREGGREGGREGERDVSSSYCVC